MVFDTIIYRYCPKDMQQMTKTPLVQQPLYITLPDHARMFLRKALAFAERVKADTYISIEDKLAVCMRFEVATFFGSLNLDLSQLVCLSDDLLVMPLDKKFAVEFSFLYDKT